MYQIVQAPNAILRTPAKPVDFSGSKLKALVDEMIATMLREKDPEGVGLAANQVNLPWKIFIARSSTKKSDPVKVFINPEIVNHSEKLIPDTSDKKHPLEGCLSKPNYYGTVKRWQWITLKFLIFNSQFTKSEEKTEKFEGFPSTVIQHEIDHLNGKIFIERILEQKGKLFKILKSKSGEDEWGEVDI